MNNRWAPLVLVLALGMCVIGTSFLYANSQSDVYSSRAVVSLSPRETISVGADNLQLAASRYEALLSSASTMTRIAERNGVDPTAMADATQVAIQPNTVNIEIVVTMADPTRAALLSNALAAAALVEGQTDSLMLVELVVPGVVADAPSGPPRQLIMLGGLGVALVLAVVAVTALGYFQNSPVFGSGPLIRVAFPGRTPSV